MHATSIGMAEMVIIFARGNKLYMRMDSMIARAKQLAVHRTILRWSNVPRKAAVLSIRQLQPMAESAHPIIMAKYVSEIKMTIVAAGESDIPITKRKTAPFFE